MVPQPSWGAPQTLTQCASLGLRTAVSQAARGDVTGDGHPDLVVALTCEGGAVAAPDTVMLYDGRSLDKPNSIGSIISEADAFTASGVVVDEIIISGRRIYISSTGIAEALQSRNVIDIFDWRGGKLLRVHERMCAEEPWPNPCS